MRAAAGGDYVAVCGSEDHVRWKLRVRSAWWDLEHDDVIDRAGADGAGWIAVAGGELDVCARVPMLISVRGPGWLRGGDIMRRRPETSS